MALTIGELVGYLTLDSKGFDQGVGKAQGTLSGFGQGIGTTALQMAKAYLALASELLRRK